MKHEIEIPDLPEGWEAVAYRVPVKMVDFILLTSGVIAMCSWDRDGKYLIVREKQPRRIVLEEVVDDRNGIDLVRHGKYWKIVEDNQCAE